MRRFKVDSPDPSQEGWQSEAIAAQISEQLEHLSTLIAGDDDISTDKLASLVAANFSSGSLRPEPLREVYRDDQFTVVESDDATDDDIAPQRGADGLAAALRHLIAPLRDARDRHAKLKLVRLELLSKEIATVVYYQTSGRRANDRLQQNATWNLRWSRDESDPPRLISIYVRRFQQVTTRAAGNRLFVDVAPLLMRNTTIYRDQFAQGIDYHQARIPRRLGIFNFGHHGLALGDVNGDGLDDVYLAQPGGLPNRLLLHNTDGTVSDISAAAGVDALDFTRSALLVDLDNDGHQDLAISTAAALLVFAGNGNGGFSLKTELPEGRFAYSLSAADYDGDGDLDLYVCHYQASAKKAGQFALALPFHDANNGGANVLLRNDGAWRFHDATGEAGLDENNRRFSFAAAWEDYDDDGDLDLYVANDYGRNNLYRNDGGRFRDVAAAAEVEDIASGMSAAWGDYNRDGRMDLYVGNMFSAAGGRVAYQRKFHAGATAKTKSDLQRLARGNSLFAGTADGVFRDVSIKAGAAMGRWAWSSQFVDINGDGWEDLLVANGYLTGTDKDDL